MVSQAWVQNGTNSLAIARKQPGSEQQAHIAGLFLAVLYRLDSAFMVQVLQSKNKVSSENNANRWQGFTYCFIRPFGKQWWLWLMLTGVGLGLTVSCKWVGLFTIATIGLSTIRDLWRLWGDLSVPAVKDCSLERLLRVIAYCPHRSLFFLIASPVFFALYVSQPLSILVCSMCTFECFPSLGMATYTCQPPFSILSWGRKYRIVH